MAQGLYEIITGINKQIKGICCKIESLGNGGGGGNARPYKVYTALLTQSGGQNTDVLESGDLTVGVTYKIQNTGGGDWTNVGAPNNDIDTWFVATGTTPNSWGVAGSLFYDTGAPVVTVLENTIGNIWFTYIDEGVFEINSNGLFTINKIWSVPYNLYDPSGDYINCVRTQFVNNSAIRIYTVNVDRAYFNGILDNTPIEIRVYN